MSIQGMGNNSDQRSKVNDILLSGNDQKILAALRDQTAAIIVFVRVAIEQRREEKKAEIESNIEIEKGIFP